MPSSNRNFGLQPSSSLIFVASIAYRLSWPGRSGTNEIRSSDFLEIVRVFLWFPNWNIRYYHQHYKYSLILLEVKTSQTASQWYLNIEPISNIGSIAIERNSLVLWNLWYKKWDEGNEILIRSIIIRTTSNSIVDSKCPTISLNKNISWLFDAEYGLDGSIWNLFR